MTFGSKLKKIRISMELSQEEFAKKLNTTKQVISRYETEQRTPKITIAQNYADILGIPLNDLIDNNIELNLDKNSSITEETLSDEELALISAYRSLSPEERVLFQKMISALPK